MHAPTHWNTHKFDEGRYFLQTESKHKCSTHRESRESINWLTKDHHFQATTAGQKPKSEVWCRPIHLSCARVERLAGEKQQGRSPIAPTLLWVQVKEFRAWVSALLWRFRWAVYLSKRKPQKRQQMRRFQSILREIQERATLRIRHKDNLTNALH